MLFISADVTVRQSVNDAVAIIGRLLRPTTTRAHNASGYGRGLFLEIDPEQVRRTFEANIMGALFLAQAAIPGMLTPGHDFIALTGAMAAL